VWRAWDEHSSGPLVDIADNGARADTANPPTDPDQPDHAAHRDGPVNF